VRLALLAALAAGPVAARAQGSLALGGGVSAFSLSSDLLTGGSRTTWEFTFSYRFATFLYAAPMNRLSMELLVTGTDSGFETLPLASPSYPADSASFSILAWGFRFDLLDPASSRWSPWVGISPALASLQWKAYFHAEDAAAALLSVGVDVELLSGLLLRARLSTLQSGAAGGLSYRAGSLGLAWEFFRPLHQQRPAR